MGEPVKWSKKVHKVHEGALAKYGWSRDAPAEVRHEALRRCIRDEGYATTIERLSYIRNVPDAENNAELKRVAAEDQAWAEQWEHDERGNEDRARPRSDGHDVVAHDRVTGEHVRRHWQKNPRRRS
jgi:hypothetical protein